MFMERKKSMIAFS